MEVIAEYIKAYKDVERRFWKGNPGFPRPKDVWRGYDHEGCELTKPICHHSQPMIDVAIPLLDDYQTPGRPCTMMYALMHRLSGELCTESWDKDGCSELYIPELDVRDPGISIHDIFYVVREDDRGEDAEV